ncbi:MAG TPA: ABC transporter ATP-binding protein, partial [Candidatus Dormibacteraeota bacterium]|nr:ABC transporter ATP-binding protein [Candidatus Dormibacteraeota bacterium]
HKFDEQARTIRETTLSGTRARAELWSEINLLPNLSLAAVLLLGGLNVVEGRLTIGGLVAFMSYVFMLTWPMDALGWVLSMSEECQTAVQRLNEVFDSRPEIADRPSARPLEHSRGRLEFRGVGFKYPNSDEWILRDLNLVIESGETVGLVGRTGSGKTTLAYLAPRLYDVDEGAVLLDGIDVREIRLRSLRSHIGFAFEDPILFSASVHENLVMGRPIVSDEELKRALEVAQAQFIWELPWGLETRVGEQGYTLSGGQRQRLALARAVLGSPPVLVLDDPLSSVDVHTEAVIEEALAGVLEGATGLLVVHRPSTLALADRVALIDGGTIVATGTHTQLMHTNVLYRALLSQEYEEALA